MKIAAYVDAGGVPVSLYQPGALHVYEEVVEGDARRWQRCAKLPFQLDDGMSLKQVKDAMAGLVEALGPECKVLLSGEVRGLPYSVLQEWYEFRTWKSEGGLTEQLDFVRDRESEAQAQRKYEVVLRANQQVPAPIAINGGEPGHFWIDLRAALEHTSNPTSRNILIPFLNAGLFVKLEVLCGHLPKWMAWEIERLDLAAESEPIDATGHGLRVTIYSRKFPEGMKRLPGLAGAGDALCLPCPRDQQRQAALPAPDNAEWVEVRR